MSESLLSPLADLQGIGEDQPVWGIDTSTWRFSVGIVRPEPGGVMITDNFVTGDGWAIATVHLSREEELATRLAAQYSHLVRFFTDLRATLGDPILAIIETPFSRPSPGRNSVHPESFYAVGVGAAALRQALGYAGIIDFMGPSEWKLPAMGAGRGNSKKPEILYWARSELGYPGECASCGNVPDGTLRDKCKNQKPAHDEADSLGLAIAGARRLSKYGRTV